MTTIQCIFCKWATLWIFAYLFKYFISKKDNEKLITFSPKHFNPKIKKHFYKLLSYKTALCFSSTSGLQLYHDAG